jgi:rubrerythrin
MSWAALGALLLGLLLLKAIFDPNTNIYKCPNCGLTIAKNTPVCPRCRTGLAW